MRVGFALQVTLPCSACQAPQSLPGLAESCVCGKCGARAQLPAHLWRSFFSEHAFAEAAACEQGDAHTLTDPEAGSMVVYGRLQPRCHRCKLEVPVESLEACARIGHHACACGERIRVREADSLARALLPSARFVVREQAPDAPAPAARPFILVAELSEAELARMAELGEEGAEVAAAADPNAAPAQLSRLARSEDWTTRAAVARNPATPADVLSALAGDDDSDVVEALAENPTLSVPLCEQLCEHEDSDVRAKVIRHARTPLAVVRRRLEAGESDSVVLEAMAARPDADLDLLLKLHAEGDTDVHASLARSPAADDALLTRLALGHDSDVARALLRRKTLPLAVLRALTSEAAAVDPDRVRAHPSYPLLAAFNRRVYIGIGLAVLAVVGFMAAIAVRFPETE